LQFIGIVERVDSRLRRLKVDGEWFGMNNIVSVISPDSEFADGF